MRIKERYKTLLPKEKWLIIALLIYALFCSFTYIMRRVAGRWPYDLSIVQFFQQILQYKWSLLSVIQGFVSIYLLILNTLCTIIMIIGVLHSNKKLLISTGFIAAIFHVLNFAFGLPIQGIQSYIEMLIHPLYLFEIVYPIMVLLEIILWLCLILAYWKPLWNKVLGIVLAVCSCIVFGFFILAAIQNRNYGLILQPIPTLLPAVFIGIIVSNEFAPKHSKAKAKKQNLLQTNNRIERLTQLKRLLDKDLITQQEFEHKKAEIIGTAQNKP